MAAIKGFFRYLSGAPITARASGLILDDRAGERIAEALRPSNERNGEERAQFAESFAPGNAPDHSAEKLLSGGGRREAGGGRREPGGGRREAGSGKRRAWSRASPS